MSTEREELDGLANDIYEHSRLRSAEADGLAVTLSRLGYRKQEPVSEPTEAEVEAGREIAKWAHLSIFGNDGPADDKWDRIIRAALVAARAVTNPAVPVEEER